jgi:antitoxin Phd
MEWRLAEAKNKLSEVVNRALVEGPQRILRRKDAVVVIAERDYEKLAGARPGFKDFLLGRGSGVDFEGVDLSRDRSPMRDTRL